MIKAELPKDFSTSFTVYIKDRIYIDAHRLVLIQQNGFAILLKN